jgi:hypothetical protein
MNNKCMTNSIKVKKSFSQQMTLAGNIVSKKGYVSVIDLFLEIGWLTPEKINDWRQGKIAFLEKVITANLSKISRTMKELKSWADYSNLQASVTVYKHKNHRLRFSKTGELNIEMAYCTHFVLIKT